MAKRVQSIIQENFILILSLALLFAWFFEIRFTGLLFLDAVQVQKSYFFSFGSAVTIVSSLLLIRPSVWRLLNARNASAAVGFIMTVCAVITTLIPYLTLSSVKDPYNLLYLVNGFLFGIVYLGMILWGVLIYKRFGLITAWILLITSSAIALILLILSNWLLPWSFGYLYALLPILSFLLFRTNLQQSTALSASEILPQPVLTSSNPGFLHWLLFFTGFYIVYMPTMFPKTTNLTIGYFGDFCLGGLNYVSMVALILYIAFLIFIFLFASSKTIRSSIIAFLITGVFAFVFYFLSSMNTSNFSFLIIMPCSMVFVLCSCALFFATLDVRSLEAIPALRTGMIWLFSGAFLAAVFSTLFMGPLYGAISFQDTFFVIITAAVFITIVALIVGLHSDFAALLFPGALFKEKLDSSTLKNRCRLIGAQFKLTGREMDVLLLMAEGRNEPYITDALMISRATTKTHIKHIYQKIHVSSRQELLDFLYLE